MHNFSTSTRIVQVQKFFANYTPFLTEICERMHVCPDLVQVRLRKTKTIFQCFLSGR
jgi:hypothetical protein